MSSAPSTPMMSLLTDDSIVAAPLRLERLKAERMEGVGSPTSPGMTASHARREAAEAAAFHNTLSGESSPEDDGDSDTDIPRDCKPNTGRWTDAEHKLFLKGLECFPYRAWKKIATLIKTRSVVQIRTHAQKYYQKLAKEEAKGKDRDFASPFGMDHDRKATSASMKKRKYSFEDSHYSRKLLRERKDAELKVNMEALKPPCLRSSTATADARARNMSVDISVAVNTNGVPSPMLPPRRPVTVSRGMVAFDAPMVVDFPETKVKTDFDPSLERLSPVSADAMPGTDEDWFSSSSTSEMSLKDETVPEGSAASSPVSMTKKNQFLPIYHCDAAFDFGHDSTDLILFEDEAPSDEFVLDPQTFLTCYFNKES